MKEYSVHLESEVFNSYLCTRAANSLDIDPKEKSRHDFRVLADIESEFSIGLIVGSSGSGKTTLAKQMFGENCFKELLNLDKAVVDQFPKGWNFEKISKSLMSIGLTSVPCWIRPAYTLSNGQRFRAEAALQMAYSDDDNTVVIDEWTSVVDRTVAKVMSHCLKKYVSKSESKRVVLLSCHYDVIEWLDPDWIINCNEQKFIDRRSLRPDERERKESLHFDVAECSRSSWGSFSKYHYLSKNLPAGKNYFFGLYHEGRQIGFGCYSNYVPKKKGKKMIMHSNRVVIHPDFAGFGLGLRFVNETARIMTSKGYAIYATFSSVPMLKARLKDKRWKLLRTENRIGVYKNNAKIKRNEKGTSKGSYRSNVRIFTFKYIGP